jgi:16S rRNA (cytosine967-C5)-methyltransferase
VASEGAWATPALDAEIHRARLDRRDAALATEITYGALRVLPRLDATLDAHLSRPSKVDPFLRAALRVGAYQLLHLSRAPSHAVVSDAVAIVKRERGPRLSGVANAVLRKVAASRPETPAAPERVEVPPWVAQALERSLGRERAAAFLEARPLPPPLGLRAVRGDVEARLQALREARPEAMVERAVGTPRGLWIRGAGDPRALPGFAEGELAVQELGSQLVVALAGVAAGERIADLCAGHGTKSLAMAEQGAEVLAVDLYEEKLERALAEGKRLGLALRRMALDLTVGTGGLGPSFDRVIVDAPCTGLGTLHRRPELLLRVQPIDPARLAELQTRIVTTAVGLVRPGGVLVFAVCSPTAEEGIEVMRRIEAAHPRLERMPSTGGDPIACDEDGLFRIGPWSTLGGAAPDAYQVARWRVTDAAT